MELDDKIYEKIVLYSRQGDDLLQNERYDAAIKKYNAALNLLPHPKTDWEASTWLYAALGDACFFKGEYAVSRDYFYEAMNCPDGETNPFILLRLGQCLFECSDFEKAKEYLLRCYMLEGYGIFKDQDPKYIHLILDLL